MKRNDQKTREQRLAEALRANLRRRKAKGAAPGDENAAVELDGRAAAGDKPVI